ncbi:MAG TPA: glycosyltransferase family 39 protein, partial [Patescibacteria group bacterium]
FRFYLLFQRANFGWDQVDSAWAAKGILMDKHILINGPVAKGNSGIYMGPLYYYLVTIVYFFTNLDPIASPIFQGFMGIANFLILFYVTKKIFNTNIALIACFINTFSALIMSADRVQSAFYLIVPISYLIFYALLKVVRGKVKYLPLLAVFTGLSFHVDFTSVLYPLLIIFVLPFLPKTKQTIKYLLLSVLIFSLFLAPSILSSIHLKTQTTGHLFTLFHTTYHGIHLKRLLQLLSDAFISYGKVLQFSFLGFLSYLVLPVFGIFYYKTNSRKDTFSLLYLMALWVIIPWIVLSTYSGELTDYYFLLPQDIAIASLAFITLFTFQQKFMLLKVIPIILWAAYAVYGFWFFLNMPDGNLIPTENGVKQTIKNGGYIPFKDHKADSYMYYVYTRKNK